MSLFLFCVHECPAACLCVYCMHTVLWQPMALQRGGLAMGESVCRGEGCILVKEKLVYGNDEICAGEGRDCCVAHPGLQTDFRAENKSDIDKYMGWGGDCPLEVGGNK